MPGQFRYPQPANEAHFEEMCRRLLMRYWPGSDLKLYGKRGEVQHGVDIIDVSAGRPSRVAQCKLHEHGKSIPPREIRSEVEKASRSQVTLTNTTSSRPPTHGRGAHGLKEVNDEQRRSGEFSVHVWQWDDIEGLLEQYADVAEGLYGIYQGSQKHSLLRSMFVLGGQTTSRVPRGDETEEEARIRKDEEAHEDFVLRTTCTDLGRKIARGAVDLIVCSPFPDSADAYVVDGYCRENAGGEIHFFLPDHKDVWARLDKLKSSLPTSNVGFPEPFKHPSPEGDAWGPAWLYCQLQALEYADALVCVGGRIDKTATTLIHFAEGKHKTVVPFSFLGGAAEARLLAPCVIIPPEGQGESRQSRWDRTGADDRQPPHRSCR